MFCLAPQIALRLQEALLRREGFVRPQRREAHGARAIRGRRQPAGWAGVRGVAEVREVRAVAAREALQHL